MDRDRFRPSFMGRRALSLCPTEVSLGCQMSMAVCSHMKLLIVGECVKILIFPQLENTSTAVGQPSTSH